MPFQRLQTVAGHEMTISDHQNKNEPATLLFLSFLLVCLLCFFGSFFVSFFPVLQTKDHQVGSNNNNNYYYYYYYYYNRKSGICKRLFKQTRSRTKPRRRPIAASASCATAMGKKPSEIRQKQRPKRKAFPSSVQRYIFSPPHTVVFFFFFFFFFLGGGGLFMPTFAKGQKSARKKHGNLRPHFTLGVKAIVQLKSSISIGAKS